MRYEITIYISSGQKNGFYTLRQRTIAHDTGRNHFSDQYIKTLSTDRAKAEKLAKEYFDRCWSDRPDAKLDTWADFELCEWGKGLPTQDVQALRMIESGLWPFGKLCGHAIENADNRYILWWAEQEVRVETKAPAKALIEICFQIATDRGLIAEKKAREDAAKKAAEERKAKQKWIGEIGKRREFEGTLVFQKDFVTAYGLSYINKFEDDDGDVFVYFGTSNVGRKGDKVKFVATIHEHSEFRGDKQTIVKRPSKITVKTPEEET